MENTLHDFFKLSKIENTSSSEKQTFSMQELEEELHFLLQKLLQEKHGDFSITVEQNISFFLEKEELITILKSFRKCYFIQYQSLSCNYFKNLHFDRALHL